MAAFWALGQGPAVRQAVAADDGFRPIFDGKTLDGWDGDPRLWKVEDGTITGETTKENPAHGNTFLIWRGGKPADFEIRAEFRMPNPGFANSGIQIRSWEGEKWRVSGYQPDMDSEDGYTGTIYGEGYRGGLAGRGEKVTIGPDGKRTVEKFADGNELKKFIKNRGWNEYHIIARGNHISEEINGHLMCELVDNDKVARKDGIIALQIHAGPPMKVQFRNFRLKQFTAKKPAAETSSSSRPEPLGQALAAVNADPRDAKQRQLLRQALANWPANCKKIVFIAGGPSHGYAEHEHAAGCMLLAGCLSPGKAYVSARAENVPGVGTIVSKGWPKDPQVLEGAAAVVIYSDGGGGHPAMAHLDELAKLMKQGVGLACIHYAVELPTGKPGDLFKNWIGGYFETFWSVNPHWQATFKEFPKHPVANGVKPFTISDEWYYHMRFMDGMQGVTPILTAVPPDSTRRPGNDSHGANPHVLARKGMAEHVAWVCQRPDGGRGFGFTGGHFHWNWGCDNFRKVVLNGIAWTAKIEIPPDGIASATPTLAELEANQDKPQPKNFDRQRIAKMMEGWKKLPAGGE
jgi:type 1 glutamine amidotransferase